MRVPTDIIALTRAARTLALLTMSNVFIILAAVSLLLDLMRSMSLQLFQVVQASVRAKSLLTRGVLSAAWVCMCCLVTWTRQYPLGVVGVVVSGAGCPRYWQVSEEVLNPDEALEFSPPAAR